MVDISASPCLYITVMVCKLMAVRDLTMEMLQQRHGESEQEGSEYIPVWRRRPTIGSHVSGERTLRMRRDARAGCRIAILLLL